MDEYTLRLEKQYGKGIIEKLNKKKWLKKPLIYSKMLKLIKKYKNETK